MALSMEVPVDVKMSDDGKDTLSLTDDEDEDFEEEHQLPELTGTLSKWTNYIHGWQDRYIVLKDGTLSYYKSENETGFGCRGAVSLAKAVMSAHEFDECRIDVSVNDCVWYLRAKSEEERQTWMDGLEVHRQADSGYGSENGLRRHGSMISLASGTSLSTASTSSFKRGRGLREKLAEMETFRDILGRQVDTLQNYFDACASALAHYNSHINNMDNDDDLDVSELPNGTAEPNHYNTFGHMEAPSHYKDIINILQQHGAHAIDFKGESFTFKATTAGILATLSHTLELMTQREETWRRRLEKEIEKRKKYEEAYKSLLKEKSNPAPVFGGPDYEEGPHSKLNEEEFFDAIDNQLDQMDKEEKRKKAVRIQDADVASVPPTSVTSLDTAHHLYNQVESVVRDHLTHADMTLSNIADSWTLVADEGDMKVYKREMEEDGMVVDPLKAVITVKGITGHELCHYFWEPQVRMEWESTLEQSNVIEWLSKDTLITHQVHKRIWPSTQRDSLFWSTIRHVQPAEDEDEGPDYWLVVNHSTEHEFAPPSNKCVRIRFNVAMICQTVVQPPDSGKPIQRENLTCKVQYSANVNPGGWAPASVIRAISKRELPKFLKTFTSYVQDKTATKPIMF